MNGETFVIDASIAIKWVIEEDGTPEALALRGRGRLVAPDLFDLGMILHPLEKDAEKGVVQGRGYFGRPTAPGCRE